MPDSWTRLVILVLSVLVIGSLVTVAVTDIVL